MNNTSWRHHYIPEFYLKGFTNEENTFKIYDVQRKKFIRNGKDFSTKSYFFEEDGNTILTDKGADDFIEKGFAEIDNRVSSLFNKVRIADSNTRFGLSENDMPALQHFVSVLFWRIPSNYDKIKKLIHENELHEFGLLIKSKLTNETVRDEELENKIRNNPSFFKALKLLLPNLTYKRLLDCDTPLTIQTFPKELPALCSDNPVIFEKSNFPDIYYDDFIFPLTNRHVLIRANKINPNVPVHIKITIDLIVLKQANKYVSCTDSKYIGMLENLFAKQNMTLDKLKEMVFRTLIDSKIK
ncbi:DUF4238 domain-containing protein [Belliella marina]|uniref:DUF4238 domain-containing protein n=1 Tax=Belliella marina TaxID=1644146 RepID=A0ABW4VIB7_9BACT